MTRTQLGELILQSERQLYVTAKTILYRDEDCADAVQETIAKAFAKIHTLKKDSYAKTWLIRILINECYTILRASSREISVDVIPDHPVETPYATDAFDDVYNAVNSLREELRLPVILYYFNDMSVREVARILDISEGAVQKRLARARSKMKTFLTESEALG